MREKTKKKRERSAYSCVFHPLHIHSSSFRLHAIHFREKRKREDEKKLGKGEKMFFLSPSFPIGLTPPQVCFSLSLPPSFVSSSFYLFQRGRSGQITIPSLSLSLSTPDVYCTLPPKERERNSKTPEPRTLVSQAFGVSGGIEGSEIKKCGSNEKKKALPAILAKPTVAPAGRQANNLDMKTILYQSDIFHYHGGSPAPSPIPLITILIPVTDGGRASLSAVTWWKILEFRDSWPGLDDLPSAIYLNQGGKRRDLLLLPWLQLMVKNITRSDQRNFQLLSRRLSPVHHHTI